MEQDSFWDENNEAQTIFKTLTATKHTVEQFSRIQTLIDDASVYVEMIQEDRDSSDDLNNELDVIMNEIQPKLDNLEVQSYLSGKYDASHCIFSLHSGAGGTDAQDWTQMLLRMYTRWMDQQGFTYETVDQSYGDEAGIKSATLMVSGHYAYGFLKNEIGVHRLVRLYPFNANNKRQTSFSAVEVVPQIALSVNLDIDPKDLKVDTFRASGAGGQHVNKTDSAVRITHIPTGTVSQSQSSRSQNANRETAMTMLMSRLQVQLEEAHIQKLKDLKGSSPPIGWGNKIRSYVFHPYSMVKDHRTDHQTSNLQDVMNGDLNPFIHAYLKKRKADV